MTGMLNATLDAGAVADSSIDITFTGLAASASPKSLVVGPIPFFQTGSRGGRSKDRPAWFAQESDHVPGVYQMGEVYARSWSFMVVPGSGLMPNLFAS